MGKKHNKFKKRHKSNEYRGASTEQAAQPIHTQSNPGESAEIETAAAVSAKSAPEISGNEIETLNEKYAFVRHDVRHLILVLTTLVVLFVATYFLNTKTSVLTNIGDWIYRVGHFSI